MKKILIINQPVNNRGDEAAHKSLVRALSKNGQYTITVLFDGVSVESLEMMSVKTENVNYVRLPIHWGFDRILKYVMGFGLTRLFCALHPTVRRFREYVCSADYIVNAPGGICMGLFQGWRHILWLKVALCSHKKVAYYSRSFGPFPRKTFFQRKFEKYSKEILRKLDFLSVRDEKTMDLADSLGLSYVKSIDTAFLDCPSLYVQEKNFFSKEYIVFVPNSLTWHPAYAKVEQEKIDGFYVSLIKKLQEKYVNLPILFLPQLFNDKVNADRQYFLRIKDKCQKKSNLVVLSETYSSDLQQFIISKAKCVIGARYHSVVFAINNKIPFVALSYEHKIAGLVSILNLHARLVDITQIGQPGFEIEEAVEKVLKQLGEAEQKLDLGCIREEAHIIAVACFNALLTNVNA